MTTRLSNFLCCLITAAAFAMIGLEAAGHHGATHSGTQQVEVQR